jgi:broad specificity phosphatase PhoE
VLLLYSCSLIVDSSIISETVVKMAPVPPTSKKIHLTRHAQAEHNVAYDYTIPDAPLTALGREQSKNLHSMTKDNIQQTADLLVSSVMRRPMETMLIGYADLQKRLEKEGKPPIILDTLQEVNQ